MSGYVAILTGRSRATEDIDTIIEPLSSKGARDLASRLRDEGYWGATAPLEDLHEMLADGLRVRVAEDGRMTPNFELWFPKNEYDRRALEEPLVARIDGHEVNVGPLEQQIAYKLFLGTEKDFEDSLHLYLQTARESRPSTRRESRQRQNFFTRPPCLHTYTRSFENLRFS